MAITERRIMRVNIDKWDDMLALEREFQKLEEEIGIASKKRWLRSIGLSPPSCTSWIASKNALF